MPAELAGWVQRALDGEVRLRPLIAEDGSAWGEGYELTRAQQADLPEGKPLKWKERVWVVRSHQFAAAQQRGLHQRLSVPKPRYGC